MVSHDEVLASLHLNALRDVGPARFQYLIKQFGSAFDAVKAGATGWRGVRLFDADVLDRIATDWSAANIAAVADAESASKAEIQILLLHDGFYPCRLREIASPPPVLYVRGNGLHDDVAVALVGSRRSSYYAEKTARWLSADLAMSGITTVSGLARGIDTCVHDATIRAGGATWAVLGSGLSHIYPPENKKLADSIVERGALISEFPMSSRPHPSSFPRRNRIISGLCAGTVVVEGGEKSGSLITARLAADQGREVMAVPGPLRSAGTAAPHLLIKAGATLVESAQDVLDAIGSGRRLPESASAPTIELAAPFEALLREVGDEPVSREVLTVRLGKTAAELSTLLLELELQGRVRCLSSGSVVKT